MRVEPFETWRTFDVVGDVFGYGSGFTCAPAGHYQPASFDPVGWLLVGEQFGHGHCAEGLSLQLPQQFQSWKI